MKKRALAVFAQFFPLDFHPAPIGLAQAADALQEGGFPAAVAAGEGAEAALGDGEGDTTEDVLSVLVVAIPDIFQLQNRLIVLTFRCFSFFCRGDIASLRPLLQPQPSRADGHGTGCPTGDRAADLHRGGQHGQQVGLFRHQLSRYFLRSAVGVEFAVGQHHHLIYGGVQLLHSVLGQDDRHAKLLVDASEHLEERPGGHRVQLGGGLVQHQHVRLHDHDTG